MVEPSISKTLTQRARVHVVLKLYKQSLAVVLGMRGGVDSLELLHIGCRPSSFRFFEGAREEMWQLFLAAFALRAVPRRVRSPRFLAQRRVFLPARQLTLPFPDHVRQDQRASCRVDHIIMASWRVCDRIPDEARGAPLKGEQLTDEPGLIQQLYAPRVDERKQQGVYHTASSPCGPEVRAPQRRWVR